MISNPYGARMGSLPRSIPPSLRETKRNPLGIRILPMMTSNSGFYMNRKIPGCDDGH